MVKLFNKKKNPVDDSLERLEKMLENTKEEKAALLCEIEAKKDQVANLKNEIKQLKLDKRIEEDEIRHKLRMREEKLEIEKQQWMLEQERKSAASIAKVKDDYRDKLEDFLTKRGDDIKSMYSEILERLPNVNMRIKEDR